MAAEPVKRYLYYYLPVVLWLVVIFIVSSLPSIPDLKRISSYGDKIAHYGEFGILGFLIVRAVYYGNKHLSIGRALLFAFGIGLFFAAADEFHQIYTPDRIASFNDFAADCLGILSAQFVFWGFLRNKKRQP